MDALTYFLLHYGLYSFLLVVPAALLGAAYGWFTWGRHRTTAEEARRRMEEAQQRAEEVEITLSKEREQFQLFQEAAENEGMVVAATPDLNRDLSAALHDKEMLEASLAETREQRQEAEEALAVLQKEKAELEKALAAQNKELAQKQGKKAGSKGAKKKAAPAPVSRSDLKKFKIEKRELEKKLATREREHAKQVAALRKEVSRKGGDLEKKLAAVQAEADKKREAAEKLQEAHDQLKTKLGERSAESKKLTRELADLEKARTKAEEELGAVVKERDDKVAKLEEESTRQQDELRSERDRLQSELEALESSRRQDAEKLEDLAKESARLESSLAEVRATLAATEQEFAEVRTERERLEGELSAACASRDEAKQALDELRTQHQDLESRAAELDDRVRKSAGEIEDLSESKSKLEGELRDAREELGRLNTELDATKGAVEREHEELKRREASEDKWADELHRLREEKKELNQHLTELSGDSKSEALINRITDEKERLLHDLADEKRERQQVEDAAAVLGRELHALRAELIGVERRAAELDEVEKHLRSTEERLARTQGELTKALEERRALAEEVAELSGFQDGEAAPPSRDQKADRKSRSSAAATDLRFSLAASSTSSDEEDLGEASEKRPLADQSPSVKPGNLTVPESGDTYHDRRLGLLYREEPPRSDDLTRIKGVGQVTVRRLNKAGIYTFQQIANWEAEQVAALSEDLDLRDRVVRDRWQEQARTLQEDRSGGSA